MKNLLAVLFMLFPAVSWASGPTLGNPAYNSVTLTVPLAVTSGGTGASTASVARSGLGAAASGANSDITSITGLTTPLAPSQGGLGATGLTGYPYLNGNSPATASVNIPASAITGLSGVYAPLASPTFTGTLNASAIVAKSFTTGQDSNGNISLGSQTTSGTPYIDFFGAGNSTQTNRIINSSGNTLSLYGANGTGTATWKVNGNSILSGNLQIATSNIAWSGSASPSNSMIYAVPSITGVATGNVANVYLGITDNLNAQATTMSNLVVYDNLGAGASGNRNAEQGEVYVSYPEVKAGANVGNLGISAIAANSSGSSSRGWPIAVNSGVLTGAPSNEGDVLGTWGIGQLNTNANGYFGIGGAEFDLDLANLTAPPVEKTGVVVVDQSTPFYGTQGYLVNTGFDLNGDPSWSCGFCAGKATGDWPITATGTVFGAQARAYGGLPTGQITPQALYFMDGRAVVINSGGAAIAMRSFNVDGQGNATATSLTTNGTIQAETATLTGVSITNGGVYTSVPTLTVQPPPSGTTATATVSAMGGASIVGFGSTGSGYQAGNVLTEVGGTGTAAQITVNTVDANGGILTYTISNTGSYSVPPGNPASFTGGNGTGALFEFGYTAPSGVFSITGTGQFAATGSGFAVNNVVTASGDTGTEPTFTVTAVTAQGGILMPITLTSAGSVTTLAGTTYHAMTGGSGTDASMQIGFAVTALSVTPGSNYSAAPPPLITSSVSNYLNAQLVAQMTPTPSTLSLSGSSVSISGNTTVSGNSVVTGISEISNGLKTATGTGFSTAASCTAQYCIVNAGTGGVILPAPFGAVYYVWNETGSTITVYTPAGTSLGTLTSNATGKWFAFNSTTYNPS